MPGCQLLRVQDTGSPYSTWLVSNVTSVRSLATQVRSKGKGTCTLCCGWHVLLHPLRHVDKDGAVHLPVASLAPDYEVVALWLEPEAGCE